MNNNSYKTIQKYLYNYNNIDKKIERIKIDIMENLNFSYNNWIKSKSNNDLTLEDRIISVDSNKTIIKLKKWKKVIKETLKFYANTDEKKYQYIRLKFFENKSSNEIESDLNITIKEQKDMQKLIIQHIFLYAVKNNLLRKE